MRSAYAKINLYQSVTGGAGISATPGELSVDDLLKTPSTPFRNELAAGKKQGPKKTIILNYIDLPPGEMSDQNLKEHKLKTLMVIRRLVEDGFEVYQYRNDALYKLTSLSLSQVFDFNLPENRHKETELKQKYIADIKYEENRELSVESVCVIGTKKINHLINALPDEDRVLWQSDSNALGIYESAPKKFSSNEFIACVSTLKIKYYYLNVCVDDRKRYQYPNKPPENFPRSRVRVIPQSIVYESIYRDNFFMLSDRIGWFNLEEIVVKQLSDGDNFFFKKLSEAKQLKKFIIPSNSWTGQVEVSIQQLLDLNFYQLEFLHLGGNAFSASELKQLSQHFYKLKQVAYGGTKLNLTDEELSLNELELVLPNCENLTELSLFTTENFISLIKTGKISGLNNLRNIKFLNGKFSEEEFALIEQLLPNVEEINLSSCIYLADKVKLESSDIIKNIAILEPRKILYFNAEKLDLVELCKGENNWTVDMSLSVLKGQRNLKSISLLYQEGLFEGLERLDAVNTELKELIIFSESLKDQVTPGQLKIVLAKFPSLNSLGVDISWDDIEHYGHQGFLENIEHIKISSLKPHTAQQINRMVTTMPNLLSLDVFVKLDDEEDVNLFIKSIMHAPKLVSLKLDSQSLSSLHIVRIAQALSDGYEIKWSGHSIDVSDKSCDKATLAKIVFNAEHPNFFVLNSAQDFLEILLENPEKISKISASVCDIIFYDEEMTLVQAAQIQEFLPKVQLKQYNAKTRAYNIIKQREHFSEHISFNEIGNIKSLDQNRQREIAHDNYRYGDASTKIDKNKKFELNRIFYDVSNPENTISLASYRLESYNDLELVSNPKNISQVFKYFNSGEIKLQARGHISYEAQDVYLFAKQAQADNPEIKIHYAKTRLFLNDDWQALPSLNIIETISKVHLAPDAKVDIQYSHRDNLYYIRRTDGKVGEVDIDYVLESNPELLSSLSELPGTIQSVVKFCQQKFGKENISINNLRHLTGRKCVLAIANERQGACRHKSYLLKAIIDDPSLIEEIDGLRSLGIHSEDFSGLQARIIENTCHAYIELRKDDGFWIRCDLGGHPSSVNILNDDFSPEDNVRDQKATEANNEENLVNSRAISDNIIEPEVGQELDPMSAGNKPIADQLSANSDLNKEESEKQDKPRDLILSKPKEVRAKHNAVIRDYFPQAKQQQVLNFAEYIHKFLSKMALNHESKRLIECAPDQLAGLSEKLEDYFEATHQSYYAVRSPGDLILNRPHVELGDDNIGKVKTEGYTGPLYQFLTDENISGPRILIVDFSKFTAEEIARYNSLLDGHPAVPSIDGVPLPDGTKLIAIIQQAENSEDKDSSLYSRFEQAIEQCAVNPEELRSDTPFATDKNDLVRNEDFVVDFFELSNWKEKLLGYWNIQGPNLKFMPSSFLDRLNNKKPPGKLILKNPPKNDPEFIQFFKDAKLKNYILHEGRKFPWNVAEVVIENKLEFLVARISNIYRAAPVANSYILNPSTFQSFLKQYRFEKTHGENGYLFEEDGLLKQHMNAGDAASEVFNIYVTENLVDGQWSALLAESSMLGVQLNICLAPNVTIPSSMASDKYAEFIKVANDDHMPEESLRLDDVPKQDCCIASMDTDFTIDQWRDAQPRSSQLDVVCIDVSELSVSNMLVKTTGGLNQQEECFEFSRQQGALLKLLDDSKTVILHGNFSVEVRQWLQDFLYKRNSEVNKKGQVVIVSDQAELVSSFTHITALHYHQFNRANNELFFVEKKANEHRVLVQNRKAERIKLRESEPCEKIRILEARKLDGYEGIFDDLPVSIPDKSFDLSAAKQVTKDVDLFRFAEVEDVFAYSPYVFLAGITGTGKTSFIEKVWRNEAAGRRLYVGESEIEQWLLDKEPGTKALFFTEANIGSHHWSKFEGLFNNNPPGMVVGDTYVELTENHKVFFDGNPMNYSMDRHLPSLFARHGNSVVFDPLPNEYIYYKMLLPLFNGDAAQAEKICQPILELNLYLNSLEKNMIFLTPRELIMIVQLSIDFCQRPENSNIDPSKVAKYFSYQIAKNFVPEKYLYDFDRKFQVERPAHFEVVFPEDCELTLTASNKSSMYMLTDFLQLRQKYIASKAKLPPLGLGGVAIEGMPGLGKTTLAIECLKSQGFTQRSLECLNKKNKLPVPRDGNYFYYFPAGMNVKLKEEYLIKAFHEGAVVLCDEINAAKSLEGLLNRLLMGEGPRGEAADNPGFMLISTQNPAGKMAGRSSTSLAQLHRMHYSVITDYSELEMQLILKNMCLPSRLSDALISQYLQRKETNKALCFRDVITVAKSEVRGLLGTPPKEVTEAVLLQLANNPNSSPDVLEVVYLHIKCSDQVKFALVKHLNLDSKIFKKIIFDQSNQYHQDILIAGLDSSKADGEILDYLQSFLLQYKNPDDVLIKKIIDMLYVKNRVMEISEIVCDRACKVNVALVVAQQEQTSEKILREIVQNSAFYPKKKEENKSSFFSVKSSAQTAINRQYPVCVVLAMLKLLSLKYKGKHTVELNKLVTEAKNVQEGGADNITIKMSDLVKGCRLGLLGGNGRLKKALTVMLDSIKQNRQLCVDSVLGCVKERRADFGYSAAHDYDSGVGESRVFKGR